MSDTDDFHEGEQMAIAWIEGRSDLAQDLSVLVAGMPREFGGTERGFLLTIGNAARSAARSERRSTPADAPARLGEVQAAAAGSPAPGPDIDDFLYRAREATRQARFEKLARSNADACMGSAPGRMTPGHYS